jgi:hypothetical protein
VKHITGIKQSIIVYSGFLQGINCIARDEGVRGLYKALDLSLWLVSHGAIQFTPYERFRHLLSESSLIDNDKRSKDSGPASVSVRDSFLASTGSKLLAAMLTYPLQLVRTRIQEVDAGSGRYMF